MFMGMVSVPVVASRLGASLDSMNRRCPSMRFYGAKMGFYELCRGLYGIEMGFYEIELKL